MTTRRGCPAPLDRARASPSGHDMLATAPTPTLAMARAASATRASMLSLERSASTVW